MLVLGVIFMLSLAQYSYAWCIPCPRDGIILADFINCPCQQKEFYNSYTQKCVNFTSCPKMILPHPTKGAENLVPEFSDLLDNLMGDPKALMETVPFIKDYQIQRDAINKRFETIKKKLPSMMLPIIAPIIATDRSILKKCDGNNKCMALEILKNPKYHPIILQKMPQLMEDIKNEMSKIDEDLNELSVDCTYMSTCPLTRAYLDLQKQAPKLLGHSLIAEFFGYAQKVLPISNEDLLLLFVKMLK